MSSAERLYTPDMLALAVELARWPQLAGSGPSGDARSPTCGSTIAMQIAMNGAGQVEQIGMRVRACAVGQAAAAIFARHATGRTLAEIEAVLAGLERWLAGDAPMPEWPDLHLIAAARSFPGRHGAMLLPWRAAVSALSNAAHAG